ncbi:MAG: hypothetical protein Q4B93_04685 [Clostridia bacterium]|nr:hypothetical protein [Clostridia bacterium]
MGLRNFFNKMIDKAVSAVAGKTSVQRTNMILKMVDLNVFSYLIICAQLPIIPKNGTYYLSSSELERLKTIFKNYNANASKVKDSVIIPIVNRQIKSNGSISEFFDKIEKEIDNIPDKVDAKLADTHENLCGSVDRIMKLMYGLKAKLASKVSQNAIKDYVDAYVEKVLNAKPVDGIYWDDFLDWLSKILDQNLAYLGGLKTQLIKLKLPDKYISEDKKDKQITDAIKDLESKYKESKEALEKILNDLLRNYKTKDLDGTSSFGTFLEGLSSGSLFGIAVDKLTHVAFEKGKQVAGVEVATHKVKFMGTIDSKAYKFMGFKLASTIKSQFEGYKDTLDCTINIYDQQNKLATKVIGKLNEYIGLKNSKIKSTLLNASDRDAAIKDLAEIKISIATILSDLMNILDGYKSKPKRDKLQKDYTINLQAVDAKEMKALFKVIAKNPKIMLFEEYAHEIYNLCEKSLNSLKEVIDPGKLYVNTDLLEMKAVKFSKESGEWINRDYKGIVKRTDPVYKELNAQLNKLKEDVKNTCIKNIKGYDNEVNEFIQTSNKFKVEVEKCYKECLEYIKANDDVLKDYKDKAKFKGIAKETEKPLKEMLAKFKTWQTEFSKVLRSMNEYTKLSVNNKEEFDEAQYTYNKLKEKTQKIGSTKESIHDLYSQYNKKVMNCNKAYEEIQNFVNTKLAGLKEQLDNVQKEFNEIAKPINDSFKSMNDNYNEVTKSKTDLTPVLVMNYGKEEGKIKDEICKKFQETEEKLLTSFSAEKEKINASYEKFQKKEKEFLNKLNAKPKGSEKSVLMDKNKKCAEILEEIKKIEKEYNSLSIPKVNDGLKELQDLYANTKTRLEKLKKDFSEIDNILKNMKESFKTLETDYNGLTEYRKKVDSAKEAALEKHKGKEKNEKALDDLCKRIEESEKDLLDVLKEEFANLQAWSNEGLAAKKGEFAEKLNINAGDSDESSILGRLKEAKKCYDLVLADANSKIKDLKDLYDSAKYYLDNVDNNGWGSWLKKKLWYKKI